MGNIGISELVVILLILMLVFGASRLPALGEGLGKALRTFKRGAAQDEARGEATLAGHPREMWRCYLLAGGC